MESKPIQYHLEAYLRSVHNDPFAVFKASSPFPPFVVGDWVDGRDFGNPTEPAQTYRVKSVGHIMWEVQSHIGHKLMLVLEAKPAEGSMDDWLASPAR